jgi:DNA-binding XRE family transcriptional regulator
MQGKTATIRTFCTRTDNLSVRLGVHVQDLAVMLGISRRTLFAARADDSAATHKTWLKLENLENSIEKRITGKDLMIMRASQKMFAGDMAAKLGLSPDHYSKIESGVEPVPDNPEFSSKLRAARDQWISEKGPELLNENRASLGFVVVNSLEDKLAQKLIENNDPEEALEIALHLLDRYKQAPHEIVNLCMARDIIADLIRARVGSPVRQPPTGLPGSATPGI